MDAALAADAVDFHDIEMVQARRGAGFVLESLEVARVHDCRERQHLQRHTPLQADLLSLVHHTHPAPPNLVTITRNGRRVDAVACVTKTGHTLLFDRVLGQPIFPLELRRAPTSTLPGEVTAPYPPDPNRVQWKPEATALWHRVRFDRPL